MSNLAVPHLPEWYLSVPRSTRSPVLCGYTILVLGVFSFMAWGGLAPLDGAVISPGIFVATTQNKIVQHLEGGIIKDIHVHEGETVRAGQVLMRIDGAPPRAELARLLLRRAQLAAIVARLKAEAAESPTLVFPGEIAAHREVPNVQQILDSEQAIFAAHRKKLERDISIAQIGITSFQEQIKGGAERLESLSEQLALIKQELALKTQLLDKGLIRKPEYFAVQRAQANLKGEWARIKSEIADNQQKALASQDQISRLKTVAVQQAVEDLQKSANELKDVSERITAARRVVAGLDIIAPVDGVVVKLNYFTVGGVIRPGNDILALLPLGDELIIEVNVRPQDIDHVKIGQEALVRLPALNQRLTPMLPGNVTYVSADALPNEKKQDTENSYVARIRLDVAMARQVGNFTPTPGMPAEVFIKTGQRTFFEYLVKPVRDMMTRAFRES